MPHDPPVSYRAKALSKRDHLPDNLRILYGRKIIDSLASQPEYLASKLPLFYVSFKTEVFTHDLIKDRLKNGLKVAVPVTEITRKKIIPCLLYDWNDLKPGAYGVPEPVYSAAIAVSPEEIDLVITPGSAFDEKCGRYGYGGGYYDRFLANEAPRAFRMGLAFQTQVFPSIPLCGHDQRMDCIITETREIRCAADKHDLIS